MFQYSDDLGAASVFEPGTLSGQRLMTTLGNSLTASPVYAYHDHLGTPRRWRLGNKSIARTYEYDPYGNIYAGSGIFTTIPRIYALHEFDMGLQQYRAPFRHYRPTMARSTTLDPLGMIDGPNMYAYVGGDVINLLDPMGLHFSKGNTEVLICRGLCKTLNVMLRSVRNLWGAGLFAACVTVLTKTTGGVGAVAGGVTICRKLATLGRKGSGKYIDYIDCLCQRECDKKDEDTCKSPRDCSF